VQVLGDQQVNHPAEVTASVQFVSAAAELRKFHIAQRIGRRRRTAVQLLFSKPFNRAGRSPLGSQRFSTA